MKSKSTRKSLIQAFPGCVDFWNKQKRLHPHNAKVAVVAATEMYNPSPVKRFFEFSRIANSDAIKKCKAQFFLHMYNLILIFHCTVLDSSFSFLESSVNPTES